MKEFPSGQVSGPTIIVIFSVILTVLAWAKTVPKELSRGIFQPRSAIVRHIALSLKVNVSLHVRSFKLFSSSSHSVKIFY